MRAQEILYSLKDEDERKSLSRKHYFNIYSFPHTSTMERHEHKAVHRVLCFWVHVLNRLPSWILEPAATAHPFLCTELATLEHLAWSTISHQ